MAPTRWTRASTGAVTGSTPKPYEAHQLAQQVAGPDALLRAGPGQEDAPVRNAHVQQVLDGEEGGGAVRRPAPAAASPGGAGRRAGRRCRAHLRLVDVPLAGEVRRAGGFAVVDGHPGEVAVGVLLGRRRGGAALHPQPEGQGQVERRGVPGVDGGRRRLPAIPGVEVDHVAGVAHGAVPQGVGQALRHGAGRVARPVLAHVLLGVGLVGLIRLLPVVVPAPGEGQRVGDGHGHQGAPQAAGVDALGHPADDLDAR